MLRTRRSGGTRRSDPWRPVMGQGPRRRTVTMRQTTRGRGESAPTKAEAVRAAVATTLRAVVDSVGADFGRLSVVLPGTAPTVIAVGLEERGIAGPGHDAMAAFVQEPLPATWGRVITKADADPAFRGRSDVRGLIQRAGTKSVIIEPVFDGSRVIGTACVGTLVEEFHLDDDVKPVLTAALAALAVAARAVAVLSDRVVTDDTALPRPCQPLSRRQQEVLHLLAAGLRSSHIADHLYLSENTVRNHIKALLRAYNVKSQRELIALIHAERVNASMSRDRPQAVWPPSRTNSAPLA